MKKNGLAAFVGYELAKDWVNGREIIITGLWDLLGWDYQKTHF